MYFATVVCPTSMPSLSSSRRPLARYRQQHFCLPCDWLLGFLGLCLRPLGFDALAQRIHEVDDILWSRRGTFPRRGKPGLLLLQHVYDGLLVMIDERRGFEVGRLALKDILPLTVLRRLDCVLAPSKEKVLKRQGEGAHD